MNRHPVSFTNLVDWIDRRLDEEMGRRVEGHLATGCSACQRDLAWLNRVLGAARTDNTVEPPHEAVAKVKQLYRSKALRPMPALRRKRLVTWPRLARALAALSVLVVAVAISLTQVPSLLAREATLAAVRGTVEVRGVGDALWRELGPGARLSEGDQLRVADGIAVLTLFDGSVLQMQPGAELGIFALRSGLFSASRQVALQQQAGSVDYEVAPLHGLFSSFAVESPTVRVTVQGTRFVITVEKTVETRVAVLQGSIRLVNPLQSTVLAEREVAVVPVNAPIVLLPTLMPTHTPGPAIAEAATATATATAAWPSPTAMTPIAMAEPGQMPKPTQTPRPTTTPTPAKTLEATPIPETTTTLVATATPVPSTTIRPIWVEFGGAIERFPPGLLGIWRIGGRDVFVSHNTEIIGKPSLGAQAKTICFAGLGPSAFARQALVALKIEIEEVQPGQAAQSSPTVWWAPFLTRTPRAIPTARASSTPPPAGTIRPSRTPHAVQTVFPGLPAVPTATLQPTGTTQLVDTTSPSSTPSPTRTPKLTHTPQHPAPRSRTPTWTATPTPVATAGPLLLRFSGVIERLPPIPVGLWVVGGQKVIVTPETQIEGTPAIGLLAEVEAMQWGNAILHAVRITVRSA